MLLLVTIVLVLVAAVTLLIGIFSDELTLIFISIGASALAAIVLAVLSQTSRKKSRASASDATASAGAGSTSPAGDTTAEEAAASIEQIGEPVTVPGASAEQPTAVVASVGGLAIADYDSLRVNEILPRLEGLDLDELEAIAQHEESRKNRTTVLNRIDALMDQLEAGASAPATEVTDELAEEAATSIEEIGEPVVAVDGGTTATDGFPIPNYDSLSEDELIPLLADLDADELEAVADREEAGPNRDAVLDAIDDRLDILEGIAPAPAAGATDAAIEEEEAADELPVVAATRVTGKKAAAKKAAAKKAPAKKAATTATKAAKKAAPAKATKKTLEPAKKAPAATRASKAAPAAKKTAAAGVKAAAKKAPAKKATAAKKAAKR